MDETSKSQIEKLKKYEVPIYIYGNGLMADLLYRYLSDNNVKTKGFVVDNNYNINGRGISKSTLLSNDNEYNLVVGNKFSFLRKKEDILKEWKNCRDVFYFSDFHETGVVEAMSEDFYKNYKDEFNKVYNALNDEISKKSMQAYLNEKIYKTYKKIQPFYVKGQYLYNELPWRLTKHEVFLDCGAFTGDSAEEFICNVKEYERIICCEPDKENYKLLCNNIKDKGWEKVETYCKGLGECKKEKFFVVKNNMMSNVSDNGNHKIEIDTIDSLFDDKNVSIIKMDIEGEEMNALRGARKVLVNNRPLLMICIYHKRDDIFNVYNFINDNVKGYNFYFRCHQPYPIDAVLYAVPKERII